MPLLTHEFFVSMKARQKEILIVYYMTDYDNVFTLRKKINDVKYIKTNSFSMVSKTPFATVCNLMNKQCTTNVRLMYDTYRLCINN